MMNCMKISTLTAALFLVAWDSLLIAQDVPPLTETEQVEVVEVVEVVEAASAPLEGPPVNPQFLQDVAMLTQHPHRMAGSVGNLEATAHLEERLKELGAEVFVQDFPLARLETTRSELLQGGQTLPLSPMRPNGLIPPSTGPAGVSGTLIWAGDGQRSSYGEAEVAGSIVVIEASASDAWRDAFRMGAQAVIHVRSEEMSSADIHFTEAHANFPRFYYNGEAGDLVFGEVATVINEQRWTGGVGRNVLGFFPGSDPTFYFGQEEMFVLAAQIDTFGAVPEKVRGARMAANMAGVLQIAEQWKESAPRRHLLVAFLNNEAMGYEGARRLYRSLDQDGTTLNALSERRTSLVQEKAFIRQLLDTVSTDHPMELAHPSIYTQLFNRMRLVTDEEIENSRASMGDIRQALDRIQRASQDGEVDEARAAPLRAELETFQEPHLRLNDFRRELATRTLAPPTEDANYARILNIVRQELGTRSEELILEERALEHDSRISQELGKYRIALHATVNYGNGTERWGLHFGGSSLQRSLRDLPGLYSRVLSVFRACGEKLLENGAPVDNFERSLTSPGSQLFGGGRLIHGGEIAGRYGVFNFVLGTVFDFFPKDGTPADVVENLDLATIETQMNSTGLVLAEAANREGLSLNSPIVRVVHYSEPRFRDSRVTGSLVLRRTRGSPTANRSAIGAVVGVYPRNPQVFNRGSHDHLGVSMNKSNMFVDLQVQLVNANGAIMFGPVDPLAKPGLGIAALFNDSGQVEAMTDRVSIADVSNRLNLFVSRGGALIAPPHVLPSFSLVMNGRTNSELDGARSMFTTQDGVVYWYSEAKVDWIKVFGTSSVVALNMESETGQGLYGSGLPQGDGGWIFPRLNQLGANDLLSINEERLETVRSRGVSNLSVEELHARAEDLNRFAEESPTVARSEALHTSAFLGAMPVYLNTRQNLDDLVRSVLVLLALAVPFAFALERLLIGSPSIYRQLSWFTGFFIAVFLLLYFTHPAFAVSNAPLIIFLGFTIITLSVLVIYIIMQKFEVELKHLQGVASTVHSADVSRFSTMLAAMTMGISTMRRRPVRTALTATTIILLTFTILCFASFGGALGVTTRFIGPLPGHEGAYIHRINWGPLDPALQDTLKYRWEGEEKVTGRYWLSPMTVDSPAPTLGQADGTNPVVIQGLLGLDQEELEHRDDLREIVQQDGVPFDQGIWLSEATGNSMQVEVGDAVRLNGRELTVAGLFDASAFAAIRDMDGSSILPVDFLAMEQLLPEALDDSEGSGGAMSWEVLAPDGVVIVSAEVARQMDASLRAITIYAEDTTTATRVAEDTARLLGIPIAGTREDSVYYHRFGTTLAATGLGDLVMPIILGGLVVFGTMLGSVADREKEIYTFSALGLAPPHVASLFFAEALVFSVIGGLGGYLTAQAVLEGLKFLATLGLAVVPEINYSSTNSIITILIVMGTVMISAVYPAIKASRSANPGVMRSWQLPAPEGDVMKIVFPFTVSSYDITGVVSFLKEHFDNFKDTSLGSFLARKTRLQLADAEPLGIDSELALAPFDLGVTQKFSLRSAPSEIPGIDEVTIRLERLSGQPKDWKRLNKILLDDLRKQFLIWRSLPEETMEQYRERTLLARTQPSQTDTEEESNS